MGKQADYFRQQAELLRAQQQATFEQNGMTEQEALEHQRKLGEIQMAQAQLQQQAYMNASRYLSGWHDSSALFGRSMDEVQKPSHKPDRWPTGYFHQFKKPKLKGYQWILIVSTVLVIFIILEML